MASEHLRTPDGDDADESDEDSGSRKRKPRPAVCMMGAMQASGLSFCLAWSEMQILLQSQKLPPGSTNSC